MSASSVAVAVAPADTGGSGAHRLGVLLMIASAVAFSTAGFFTRLVDLPAPTLLFWRGVFSALTIAGFAAWRYRGRLLPVLRASGWPALVVAGLGSAAMITFVSSLRLSSVAEVSVIYATIPLATAGFGWLLLGERCGWPTLAASLACLLGMAVMAGGGEVRAHVAGDLLAFAMTLISALFMVALRWQRCGPMEPAVALAALITALVTAAWADPFAAPPVQIAWTALFGIIQNGLGLILMVLGARYITATETALYGALDAPMAPLWVWLVFAETPSGATVAGGAVVMVAVLAFIAGGRR